MSNQPIKSGDMMFTTRWFIHFGLNKDHSICK